MSTTSTTDYLGRAIAYPLQVDANGSIVIVSGDVLSANDTAEIIEEALMTLLNTSYGDRLFLPEYGCRIEELMFEQNDDVLRAMGEFYIREAIETWEGRVTLNSVDLVSSTDEMTEYNVSYTIRNSSEVQSFIYPFYKSLKY